MAGERTFKIVFTGDHSDLDRSMSGVESSFGRLSKISAVALGGIAAAAGGGLALSVKSAADFEHALDQVGAVSQATSSEMKGLHDVALRIGKDTAFGATDAAKAMEMLAANGLTAQQIMAGAADATVALAAAGGTDLATAADTASTAMQLWAINGSQMNDVVNRIAGAANVSRFGVEDMSAAIAQGGAAAKTFGVSFQDFSAAIAATATSFSSGADAGTSFKTFLMSIAAPVGAGAKAIAKYGLNFRTATGDLKPMAGIVQELRDKLGGLTKAEQDAALSKIFGSDALRMGAGLLATTREEFEQLSRTMGSTDAAEVAKQRMGNFKGSLEALKGSLEVIQISIGERLLPVLTALANFAAVNLPLAFAAVEAAAARVMPALESGFAAIGSAVERVAPVVLGAWEALGSIDGAQTAIAIGLVTAALTLLLVPLAAVAVSAVIAAAPIIALGLAIAAVTAGVILVVKHWDEIVQKFPVVGRIADAVRESFGRLTGDLGGLAAAFSGTAAAIGKAAGEVVTFVKRHWDEISSILESVGKIWLASVEFALGAILDQVKLVLQLIGGFVDVFFGVLTGDWGRAWDGLKEIFGAFGEYLSSTAERILRLLGTVFGEGLNIVKGMFTIAWDELKGVVSSAAGAIGGFVQGIVDKINDAAGWIGHYLNVAGNAFGDFLNMARWPIDELIDLIQRLIDKIHAIPSPGDVVGKIGGVVGKIPGLASGGPVSQGQAYVVGEEGPELFVPARDGLIVPNHALPRRAGATDAGGTIVFQVENLYARSETEARLAAGDLAHGVLGRLRARGAA